MARKKGQLNWNIGLASFLVFIGVQDKSGISYKILS